MEYCDIAFVMLCGYILSQSIYVITEDHANYLEGEITANHRITENTYTSFQFIIHSKDYFQTC